MIPTPRTDEETSEVAGDYYLNETVTASLSRDLERENVVLRSLLEQCAWSDELPMESAIEQRLKELEK